MAAPSLTWNQCPGLSVRPNSTRLSAPAAGTTIAAPAANSTAADIVCENSLRFQGSCRCRSNRYSNTTSKTFPRSVRIFTNHCALPFFGSGSDARSINRAIFIVNAGVETSRSKSHTAKECLPCLCGRIRFPTLSENGQKRSIGGHPARLNAYAAPHEDCFRRCPRRESHLLRRRTTRGGEGGRAMLNDAGIDDDDIRTEEFGGY